MPSFRLSARSSYWGYVVSEQRAGARHATRVRLSRILEFVAASAIVAIALVLAYAVRRWEPAGEAAEEADDGGERIAIRNDGQTIRISLTPDLVDLAGIETTDVVQVTRADYVVAPASLQFARGRHYRAVARFDGRVAHVACSVGQAVKPGHVLCVVESDAVTEAKAALLKALAQYEAASETYDRLVTLRETKLVRQQDLIDARKALEQARVAVSSARQLLVSWGLASGDIDAAVAQRDLSPSIPLRSPIRGRVLQVHVVPGQNVKSGQLLAEVADAAVLWAEILVDEPQAGRVAEGQPVSFRSASAEMAPASGRIFFVTPQVDPRTRKVTVWAELDNAAGLYRAGMFGTVRIEVAAPRPRLYVPVDAVQRSGGLVCVFVEIAEGSYELRRVQTGAREGEQVEVRYGLNGNERVVAKGGFFLLAEVARRYPEVVTAKPRATGEPP